MGLVHLIARGVTVVRHDDLLWPGWQSSVVATYSGPATLILPDGIRVNVRLDLVTDEEFNGVAIGGAWGGVARLMEGTSLFNVMGKSVIVELPDGATGIALVGPIAGEPPAEIVEIQAAATRRFRADE